MEKKHNLQKQIYNGREKNYIPIYLNKDYFTGYMQRHINEAKEAGILGYSLKAIRNKEEIKKLNFKQKAKVLDAGCGPGILINQLKALYGIIGYGADISSLAIKRAKQTGDKNIKYNVTKLEKIPYKNNFFDAVISFDVLEHVENKEKTLEEIIRVLKPGGKILIYAISTRDFLTWHWILRKFTFGKFGVDSEGGHIRENFVDPEWTKNFLSSLEIQNIKVKYFHSFFTLIIDEILFNILKIRKIKQIKTQEKKDLKKYRINLKRKIAYWLLSIALICAEILELPWKIFQLSNGFFIYGEKRKANER